MADITATVGQSNSTTANINVNTSSGPQTYQLLCRAESCSK